MTSGGSGLEDNLRCEAYARSLDDADPLALFQERFYRPPGTIYLDGNSLGLLSTNALAAVHQAINEWKTLAIGGWLEADPPWFDRGEALGAAMAPLVGAEPQSVVATGSTTINLHALVASFYKPRGNPAEDCRHLARFSV